ncbi:MAG: TonB-dependent receptor [Gemmatimonadetes bacterium]|nr:TonB-dependent receptor [Gemmatimonadota bacterium]
MTRDMWLRRGIGPSALAGSQMLVFLLAVCGVPADVAAQRRTRQDSLRDTTVVLRPLEVSVTRQQSSISRIPFAISTVDRRELTRGRATLGFDEALVSVPGLFIANRYNPSLDQRVSIRGFGSRSAFGARGVKILLDGIPQTLPDGQGQLTNVEIASLGSVEVLRGPSSSLYGNASGGVIALTSVTPSLTRATATLRAVAGLYPKRADRRHNYVKLQGLFTAPIGSGTLAVSGARTTSDGYREHSDAEINTFSLRLEQEVAMGTTLLISGHFAVNPVLNNPGSLNAGEVDEDRSQANPRNVNADAGKNVRQSQLGVNLKKRYADGGSVGMTVFGLTRDLDNPLSFANIQIDRRAFGARAQAEVPLALGSTASRWIFGVDLQRQRDDRLHRSPDLSTVTRDQLERVTEIGPFTQLAIDFGERVSGIVGVRYDRVSFEAEDRLLTNGDDSGERVMSAASTSIGLVWRPHGAIQPYANISSSFETPTTTELANRPSGPGGFNPELDPQRAWNFEAGLRGAVAGGRLTYSAAAFHVNVTDALIPFEVPSEPTRVFFRNAGKTRHRGIELAASARPAAGLTIVSAFTLADYTFQDFQTEDAVFDGNEIPGVPRQKFYGSVRYTSRVGLWVANDYNVASSYFADDANSVAIENWITADLRAGWEGDIGGWRIAPFVGVLNIFNEEYIGSVTVNAGFGRYFEPSPPRNGYLGVEISPR